MFFNKESGVIALMSVIVIIIAMVTVGMALTNMIISQHKISGALIKSAQSFYASESGIEDGLVRLYRVMPYASSYTLFLASSTAQVEIVDNVGNAKKITSRGITLRAIKKLEAVFEINADKVDFFYGAQAGDGGIVMKNGSRIKGNVFSNGSIIGSGNIDNNAIVARNGNQIQGLNIGENAMAYSCQNCVIGKDLTYVQGGILNNCAVGGSTFVRTDEIPPENMPILQEQIDKWKVEAEAGGITNVNVAINGSQSLGPAQIGTIASPKNLTVSNGAQLTITGTIFVTGNILIDNNATVELDSSHYGASGGILMASGGIVVNNNVILRGSGQLGSYLLILSESASLDEVNPAILVRNNAQGAIFYTSQGLIVLNNNMSAREVTGYKVQINNNAEVQYEAGLASSFFTSGTGGSWKVTQWREIK